MRDESPETAGDEQREMLRTVRRFAAREVDALAHDRAGRLAPEVLARARELGLFGLAIPEEFGGLGLSLGGAAAIVAELARADRSLATTIGLHNGLGTRALIELGSPALARTWLPVLARGERLASFAATEPGAGSDLGAVRTTVRRTPVGARVDGEKAYVTNAGLAGVITVLARDASEGAEPPSAERAGSAVRPGSAVRRGSVEPPGSAVRRGSALVLVPRDAAGVEVGPEERKMGLRASSTCTVRFEGASVAADHLLSARGQDDAHRALAWGRVLLSAGCLGTTRAALSRALDHATSRRQFGRPLVELGAVRAHLAEMAAAEATIERVLATACRAGEELPAHAGALKVLASELAHDACDRAVQLHGALGFLEDPGIALLARDCRVTRIFEGANDVLLVRHGSAVLAGLGLARGSDRGAPSSGWHEVAWRELAWHEVAWREAASRLEGAAAAARREHGVGAVRRQGLLQALAGADLWLHAARCCAPGPDADEARRIVLAHAARRALDRARAALARIDGAAAESAREHEVIEALLGGAYREGTEAIA